jgi:hypothetical protein
MPSFNQQATSITSGNIVTTSTFIPFQSTAEMEALQLQRGVLRVLKLDSSDEQSEARYRQGVYTSYDECLSAFTNTQDSIFLASTATNTQGAYLNYGIGHYVRVLKEMNYDIDRRPFTDSFQGLINVTRNFENIQFDSFANFKLAKAKLHEDREEVRSACHHLYEVMDTSSHDNILNMDEAMRLLWHLDRRELEMSIAIQRLETWMEEVWDVVVGQCDLAARSLRTGKLKDEAGLEELCDLLEYIGEQVGNVQVELQAEEGDEQEEGEDDFMQEG